jgi:hypothetical protein
MLSADVGVVGRWLQKKARGFARTRIYKFQMEAKYENFDSKYPSTNGRYQ